MAAASAAASHQESGYAKCILGFFLSCERLEMRVDLLPVFGRRLVVGAVGQAIARLLGLQLPGNRLLGVLERGGQLTLHLLPAREVLLERLGSRSGHRHPASFEREPGTALREGLILAR